jgi:small-conductance mechanosensitive channel
VQLSTTAADLPQATRRELEGLLADSSKSQADLRATLDQLRQTIASTDGAIANARPLAESLERFAAQADQAGKSWTELIAAVRTPASPPSQNSPPSRPFDITEYERTAAQLQQTASEVRALVVEVQGGAGTSLLNAVFWRALAFAAACFALLLLYRTLAPRVGAKRGSGA